MMVETYNSQVVDVTPAAKMPMVPTAPAAAAAKGIALNETTRGMRFAIRPMTGMASERAIYDAIHAVWSETSPVPASAFTWNAQASTHAMPTK